MVMSSVFRQPRGKRRSPVNGFGAVIIVVKEQLLHWDSGLLKAE
jgi:hypothetical protein